ncbi:uncharacterized protein LACBIDRAFT_332680 [Laccaria bicolor S238N-H82]|uniref:Predicted protein n=1 Tax=Laccaria bicolor (strain S238N-H82 / ATCC MYA-4686) TaxID=486041 RepID=B0DTI6_LACBS|nr:uncharacterized protein LACBIDRAFT_332680 [Laccaria bicolor S238N-H82]EDR02070.1 predicted protein [Laccaria bicolor S238N-H82]|eukprot:XP_001887227.1 predicted protein [Laccaria bicolor S238N-H82]
MRALEDANEVQIFRTQREMAHIPKKQKGKHHQPEVSTGPVLVDVFAWRLSTSPNAPPRRIYEEGKKTKIKIKPVVGREVGVGLDTSHLSKRRQAARVGKVSREVLKMKVNWEKENGMAWLQRGKVAKFKPQRA